MFALSLRSTALALLVPAIALAAIALARPVPAEAHPLGNFTVNRYSRLELYSDAVRVRYVLDMAEIPAFQETPAIDTNDDGALSASESEAYVATKSAEIVQNLRVAADGSDLDFALLSGETTYPQGQAGLKTLRLTLLLEAPVSGSDISLEYRDDNYSDRVGWKEIVVRAAEGVMVSESDAATVDASAELTAYPADLLSNPLDVTSARVMYSAATGAAAPVVGAAPVVVPVEAPRRAGGGFASLIDTKELTLPVIFLSLLLALGFGAVHALEPGHGKTFVAAYFVGVKGTVRQALALGLIVVTTHTIGVLAIGLLTLFGSQYILPEKLYPYLSLASGLMVLALGVRLIVSRARGWRAWRRFVSVLRRDRAEDSRGHDHTHGQSHSHEPAPGAPPWKSLLALGLADGLTPSPSALVVLLAAVSLDRIGLGLLLIIAFSVGLATVLTLVSLALLYARRFLDWFGSSRGGADGRYVGWASGRSGAAVLSAAPVCGAVVLVALGMALTLRALGGPGLPVL